MGPQVQTGRGLWAVLAALLLLGLGLSIGIGSSVIAPERAWAAILGQGDQVERAILLQLRLPRALIGLGVGAMLGFSGAILQGYLRNPLAEPSVLGTSNGAALGAVIALYFGLMQIHPAMLPLLGIGGALASLLLLLLLTRGADNPLSIILAGIAVGTLAGAGISLALNLSPNPFAAMEIAFWLMGSLEDRSFQHLALALPCILFGLALMAGQGRALDALSLGEEAAASLGVDLHRLRLRLLLGLSVGVGGAVAVTGAIGFVGLVVPHLVRPFTDRSPSAILWPSAAAGAALLTLSDVLVRVLPTPEELKLGVVTAFLGVPVFLAHLLRERRLW